MLILFRHLKRHCVRLIKYMCIFNLLLLLYMLFNSHRKSALHHIHKLKFQERNLRSSSVLTTDAFEDPEHNEPELIKDNIFWSDLSESFVPKGLSFTESMKLVRHVQDQTVKTLQRGSSLMCGDSLNAIAHLEDGRVMCVRYKIKPFYVHAEVLAFYLSRLLQMDNVPEAVLARTNASLWREVDISKLLWKENQIVAMMRRIPNVSSNVTVPQIIREAYFNKQIITRDMIGTNTFRNTTDIADVIQWGTLIVFDNLIGHEDRLNFWQRFDKGSLTGNLHNSVKSSEGKIWLIDHEKCFFYQYQHCDPIYNSMRLLDFHDKMLKTMCVFQSALVSGLRELYAQPSPFKTLWNYTLFYEPLLDTVPKDYRFDIFAKLFDKRLAEVLQWIQNCTDTGNEKY